MRVLVLLTHSAWTTTPRLLASAGAALAARGETVAFVCCRKSAVEAEVARRFPSIPRHEVSGRSAFARALGLRRIARATRAEAVLVHTERDALTAALAMGRRGGVVRRLAVGERAPESWRTRLASSRSRVLVLGDELGPRAHLDAPVRAAISWPPVVPASDASLRIAPSVPPLALAIVANVPMGAHGVVDRDGASHAMEHAAGAAALRAAARLVARHPDLRVLLVGETAALQPLRVHAGSLGLADRLSVLAPDRLLEPGALDVAAVWVTTQGDAGAVAAVAAMMRRLPVIVPRGADIEAIVVPRITGFVADENDPAGSVAALAHLLADADEHHAMGAASAARAERVHGWAAFVDRIADALYKASGTKPADDRTRDTPRRSDRSPDRGPDRRRTPA